MKKNVAILVFDDVEVLDFAGPFEVFAVADELHGHAEFHTFTLGLKPGTIRARNGLKVVAEFTLENCPPPHVIVIPGGNGRRALMQMPGLHEWLRLKSRSSEIVMSVCTGSFVLAPNFNVSFTGDFGTVGGSIVASKVSMSGSAGGTVRGSLINLDNTTMTLDGSSDVVIASTGTTNYPAGLYFPGHFAPIPGSYEEVVP